VSPGVLLLFYTIINPFQFEAFYILSTETPTSTSGCGCVVERVEDGAIIVLEYLSLKVWNTTTFECIDQIPLSKPICSMVKTRDGQSLVCGRTDGAIEIRRMSALREIVASFKIHGDFSIDYTHRMDTPLVYALCELSTDGTFVSGARDSLVRWNRRSGTILRSFSSYALLSGVTNDIVELTSDNIVSSTSTAIQIWRVSTGVCLHVIALPVYHQVGLTKLFAGHFISVAFDSYSVYNESGQCVERHPTKDRTNSIARLKDGSILFASDMRLEIRRSTE